LEVEMRAIILAAGMGKRLKEANGNLPKCLIPFKGKTILERQLGALTGFEITLVLGYKAEEIKKRFPNLNYVINEDYAKTNTIYSLGLALNDQDTFVLNGDVIFDKEIIKLLSKPNCAAVEFKGVDPEEIQVILKEREIVKIGKNISGEGEAVGIYRFSGGFSITLKKQIIKMGRSLYYEDAIDKILPSKFIAVDIGKLRAKEIDFDSDLHDALEIF
jgi:choline kinase